MSDLAGALAHPATRITPGERGALGPRWGPSGVPRGLAGGRAGYPGASLGHELAKNACASAAAARQIAKNVQRTMPRARACIPYGANADPFECIEKTMIFQGSGGVPSKNEKNTSAQDPAPVPPGRPPKR